MLGLEEVKMSKTLSRRGFLAQSGKTGVLLVGGTTILGELLDVSDAKAQGTPQSAPKAFEYQAKPLPFAYNALDGISEQTNKCHHDTHYTGYVKKRNEIEQKLVTVDRTAANANFSEFGELKRRETFNANGQILHELYWDILGGDGKPAGEVVDKLKTDFGSYDNWVADFKACAKAALGWALLVYDPFDGRLHNYSGDTHNQGGVWGSIPLIPIDVFEHAYYHDNGPDRAKYIEAFLRNLKWSEVEKRYQKVKNLKW